MKPIIKNACLLLSLFIFILFSITGFYYCKTPVCFQSTDAYYYYHEAQNVSGFHDAFVGTEFLFGRALSLGLNLVFSISILSELFGVLSLFLIYLIVKKIQSVEAGIVASFLFSFNYLMAYVFRFGYGDIESALIFLVLIFIIVFLYFENHKYLWLICLGLLTSMFLFWDGFIFLIFVVFVSFAAKLALDKKIDLAFIFAFVGATIIFAFIEFDKIYSRLFVHPYAISELIGMGVLDFVNSTGVLLVLFFIGVFTYRKNLKEMKYLFLLIYSFTGLIICFFMSRMLYFFMIGLIIWASIGIMAFVKNKKYFVSALVIVLLISAYNAVFVSSMTFPFNGSDFQRVNAINVDNGTGKVIGWWDEGHFYLAFSGKVVVIKGYPSKKNMDIYVDSMSSEDFNYSVVGFKKLCNCSLFYLPVSDRMKNSYFENLSNNTFFWQLQKNNFACFTMLDSVSVWRYDCG